MKLPFTTFLLFVIGLAPSLLAQTVNVRFIGWEQTISNIEIPTPSGLREIEIAPFSLSEPFLVDLQSGNIQLYEKPNDPELPKELIGEFSVPSGWGEVTVAVLPIPSPSGHKLRLVGFQDDWSKFPASTIRVINLSPRLSAGLLNEEKFTIKPFEHSIIKAEPRGSRPRVPLRIATQNENNDWQVLYNRRVTIVPRWRITAFIFATKTSGLGGTENLTQEVRYFVHEHKDTYFGN